MRTDHELLIAKLDAFIRKYYKDRLIRGGLYTAGLVVVFFLGASLTEYFGRFGTTARTILFWATVLAILAVAINFLVLPLLKLLRLGKTIGHEQAARIVGDHFAEVRDKLLNTLQLQEQATASPQRQALIEASIAQRSRELSPIPFAAAIDLRHNRRYLRYALPPLAVLLVMLLAAPSLITGPTKRLIAHGTEFLPEAPFRFVVLNEALQVPESEDLELRVELQGRVIPQQVEIEVAGGRIPMVRQEQGYFTHRFRNVGERTPFRLSADGFNSPEYVLEPTPNPALLELALTLEPPAYLGLPKSGPVPSGDVTIPAGTRVTWTARTRSADRVDLMFDDTTFVLGQAGADHFQTARRMLQSRTYSLVPAHGTLKADEALQYRVEVVPDLYPTIQVEQRVDSASPKLLYFQGEVGDDHGLRNLQFHYRFSAGGDSVPAEMRQRMEAVPFDPGNTRQRFLHAWDASSLRLVPGDRVEYWFEVWDNDGVNGSKSARSITQVFEAPSLKELADKQEQQAGAIKDQLQQGIKEAQELQRELDKLRRDMLDRKDMNWQDKQKMQDVLQRQEKLQQRIERTTEQLKQSQQEQRSFREVDERILEKQQQVQELFENVLSEEMKELYRQVQEMMEKLDKEEVQEQMEQMKLGQEDVEKELDRALEQFKRMEVEQMAEDIAQQLEDLSKRQEELGERTEDTKGEQEELRKEQEELNKEFEELRKELDEMERKNQELQDPMELPSTEEQEKAIQEEQRKGSDELQKQQNKKAGQSQKKAGEQMEQMAFQMRSGMNGQQQEQQEEDMDALRQLLENIVQLSFDQEANMNDLQATAARDPHLLDIGRRQKKLRDDARMVEDSLFALSKRVPQLQAAVNREMNAVNEHMDQAREHLAESRANDRHRPMAADKQQRAMTGLNNLALLLDEALQQMQQQASGMPGKGSCNKPGGNGSSSGDSKKMQKMKAQQQALQKQLEEMRKAMEKGSKPGPKDGQRNPGGSTPGMSQQLAQLAAQQAAIRKEMQRLAQELNKDGSGSGNGLQKMAEQMEKNEQDIVNKNISQETLRRQQDIMTRMLEAEKAERERELDQQRRSEEGRERDKPDPARFFEYQRTKQREAEMLRTVPPGLKPYYKARVNEYFDTFGRP